jgi:hypothetical protein
MIRPWPAILQQGGKWSATLLIEGILGNLPLVALLNKDIPAPSFR